MVTLVPITYKGGIYRHDEVIELIDDLGGYVIQTYADADKIPVKLFLSASTIDFVCHYLSLSLKIPF